MPPNNKRTHKRSWRARIALSYNYCREMYRRLQIYADNSASSSSFSSSSWKEEAMKPPESIGVSLAASKLLKFLVLFVAVPAAFFFLGRRWSSFSPFPHLTFFATNRDGSFPIISISPNANATFDVAFFTRAGRPPLPPPPPSPPPPPKTFGIMGDDGAMQNEFEVGEVGQVVEKWGNWTAEEERGRSGDGGEGESAAKTWRFSKCPARMSEYVPCLDNQEEVRRLKENGSGRGESLERHCPEEGKGLNCLVPAPDGYKQPVPWPRSRDEVWFRNVPHTRLVDDKGGQNWIKREKDKFKFPGGGTQFIHGADQYLNQISEMVPGIAFGSHTRIALDVGCGVASFGAFLLSRNVSTLSVAPKDVHENQIQFALERGVPAMLAAFATRRLLYPSQAFDLIHCSRCRINWIRDGGILLLEVNRMLRAGGYFVWAAQPVYKHEELQQETWKEMEDLTTRICWELVKKEGYIAIWRKPLNNSCYTSRSVGTQPPLCEIEDDPDRVWYVGLKPCISRLPENGYGAQISDWPARLHNTPDRLQDVVMDAHMAKEELFKAETRYWNYIIGTFVRAFRWNNLELRNVMDMRAGFGGFAAALVEHKIDCWVMNVVPTSEPNTLPVIYDRGLLGVAHDWCEPFDTYPRTYDLLHAVGLFSKERKRCDISRILLEMDRMLRPRGRAYFRDTNPVIAEIKGITDAMGWRCKVRDTEEGPYASRRLLTCDKQ